MMVEVVQNISSISPLENSANSTRAKSEKITPLQNEPISKKTHETPETEVSSSLLNQIQQNINMIHNVSLKFSMHKATGRTMVNVTEQETGELVRQIPPKQILDLAAKINDMIGILFDKKA